MACELDQIADDGGRFAILAIDQRATLRGMLFKAGRPSADADLSAFKVDVVRTLSPLASGVLIDVEYGLDAVRAAGVLDPRAGLLVASERSPHPTWYGEPRVQYSPAGRGPAFAAAHGADALKFLLRWQPDRRAGPGEPDLAGEAVDAVRAVIADCRAHGMPSVIEPLVTEARSSTAVIRSAELLAALGPDLLKLEWPGDADGCHELSKACGTVPWALLSGGVDYRTFVDRVLTAVDAGACGYIAGRAFWGDAVTLTGADRRGYLENTAAQRMTDLNAMIAGRGRSWREVAGR
jgi:tagatose-1,6-bisphosphate aldolase